MEVLKYSYEQKYNALKSFIESYKEIEIEEISVDTLLERIKELDKH